MSSKRRPISVKTKVAVAIQQSCYGALTCPLCFHWLMPLEDRILEHMNPHALSEDDSLTNLRWVHKKCADLKTNGPKHLKVDGDISKIAKAKRIFKKASGQHVSKRPMPKSNRPIPKRVDPWGTQFRKTREQ